MNSRSRISASLEEVRTGPVGSTVQPPPGWVVDNDVQRMIEGFVKSGRGHSLLIRMNGDNQCPIACEMVAAGSFPGEALRDYRKLPNARHILPLSSPKSMDDLIALKRRSSLKALRCVLVARQRKTASRVVVFGYLTGEQEKPLRQYWWTNLRRAFPTQAHRWLEESWEKGFSSVAEEHGDCPTCVSDAPEKRLTEIKPSPKSIDTWKPQRSCNFVDAKPSRISLGDTQSVLYRSLCSLSRRETVKSHGCKPTMDDCIQRGVQTSLITVTLEDAPSLERIPGEILNMILEYSFDHGSSLEVPHQRDFYNILNISKRLRAGALEYIPKRARRLVAKSWLPSTGGRRNELFSSTVLQRIESIQLDLSDLADDEVAAIEPHIQRLANIWRKGHMLSSVSVLVRPDWMRLFFEDDLHLVPHPLFTKTLSQLVDLFGDKLTWEANDFDGPSLPNGDSVLSFASSSEKYGHVLQMLLKIYHGNANVTRASFGYNALHNAVLGNCLDNARALLGVKSLDVDARDSVLRQTPLMNAARLGLGRYD